MARPSDLRAEKAIRFLEELSWLLKSYEGADFTSLIQTFKRGMYESNDELRLSNYVGERGRAGSLVGLLPIIFMNSKWFPANADIAEFATAALGMKIPRWEKISKFEMIGHIVCNLALKEKRTHHRLVRVLTDILADKEKEQFVADMRKNQVSWNEIIRRFG